MGTMHRRLLLAGLVTATLINSGCGTVCNLVLPINEEKTFGGIRADMDVIVKVTDDKPSGSGPLTSSGGQGDATLAVALMVLPFLDLPLSFVGDVITYPLARWLDSLK